MRARRLVLTMWLSLVLPLTGSAQDVRAYLSPGTTVGVGRQFVLNVEISGVQSLSDQPELPDLGGFAQYLGSSTQSSMRMVNGRTSVTLTLQHRYQALREGTFEIPPIEVDVGGRTRTTERLSLTVAAGAPGSGGGGADAGGVDPQDLFITAEATKTRVLDGEPLVVEYRIWTRVDVSGYNLTRVPEPEGFWVEDVTPAGQPQVEQRTRNGQQYTTAVIRRVALVPTGPGERTLEPIGVEAAVRVRRRDPFDLLGGTSLFGSSSVPTSVLSEDLTIDVEPLPPGRPEPFSGVVGRLALTAEVDRDSVAANEAVTLTVYVEGEGNIQAVPEPDLGLPADFEVFPPETSDSIRVFGPGLSGEKSFEYVLIPRAPGRREIGPIRMGYYHLGAGEYRTAETEPVVLTVSGTAPGDGGEGPALLSRGGVAQLREDIRFIHLGTAMLRPADRTLFSGAGFWIVALLPLVAVAGAVGVRRRRDLLEGDVAYARGLRAGKVARKRLAEARRLASGDDGRAFHAEMARALRGLVADRLNLAEAGLRTSDLEARLREEGVEDATVDEVRACLDLCDRHRFAPPSDDHGERTRLLERVGAAMTALDRAIR